MKFIVYTYFLTLFCCFGFPVIGIQAQEKSDTLIYDLYVNESIIGDMYVVKHSKEDSTVQIEATSNVDYRFLFSFHITFYYFSSFNSDGDYIYSKFTYLMNEDLKESNWVRCDQQNCYIYEEDEIKETIPNKINRTAIELYFQEPEDNEIVFSERFCDYFKVEKEDDNSYKIDFPGGSTNHYYYKGGLCSRIKINTLISDMEFIRRED